MAAEQIRLLSDVLFGQRYRLEVMVAIADSPTGRVCLSDLAEELGHRGVSNIQAPLRDLVRAGLLIRLPAGDSRRKWYRRENSTGWDFAREAAASAPGLALGTATL
jgi:hypothetical protein